jgi:hypothetical protein
MKLRLFGMLLLALPLSAFAQTYLFNQAVIETGKSPVAVVAGDFNRDGQLDLAVVNQNDNTVSVILSKTDGSFASKVDYPVGASPVAIVSGDFNGDGSLDLAVINGQDNTISILFGSATGLFSPQQTFPTGAVPVSIVAVDLNSDQKLDLATANQGDGTVSVLLGNGDGTFAAQSTVTAASRPAGLVSADFTSDGVPDLAVSNLDGNLVLLTNNGQGGFTANTTNVAPNAGALAVGDLNNDGKSDIVLVDPPSSILTVLLGDGNGGFQPSPQISAGAIVTVVALGDFDNDGKLDIAAGGGSFPNPISILRGNGDGTFQPPAVIGFPAAAPGLVVGDFNHDNYLDVASLDSGDDDVVVLLGDGKGNLTTRKDITLPTLSDADPTAFGGVGSSAIADIDQDGKPDVVVLQYTQDMQGLNGLITVLPGNGDGTFRQAITTPVANFGVGQMILSDFNGDGKIDVATSLDPTTGLISVALGNGDDTFGAPVANPVILSGVVIQDMVGGDFNKDGKGDLAAVVLVTVNTTAQVYVFTSNGDGTFQPHLVDSLPSVSESLAAGDSNHDGNLDLVAIDQAGGGNPSVFIYLGKGDGTFSAGATYTTGASFTNTVQAADFNGDGNVDITVGTDAGLDFFAGNGDGTFQPFIKTVTPTPITGSFQGDFSGDQKPDFAAGNGIVGISIANADGTFRTPFLFQTPNSPKGYAGAGDLNGDGSFDLAQFGAANPVSVVTQTMSVWQSVPTISFSAPRLDFTTQSPGTSSSPASITLVNNGNAPLSISTITATGSFAQTSNCMSSIAIGHSCSVNVTFNPTSAGAARGTLTFHDNAYPNTQVLILTGMGGSSDFSITAAPSSNSVMAGAAATYTATLAPIDGFSGTVQLACAGAPTKATCTLSKTSVTLDGSSSVDVTVTVTTTAPTTASFVPPSHLNNTFRPLWACIGFVPIAGLFLTRKRKLAAIAAFGIIAFASVSCGGGSNSGGGGGSTPGTPPGTYSLKISGTEGSLVHTSTITLTVK